MSAPFPKRLGAAALALAAGLALAWGLKALDAERHLFHTVASGFNNGPLLVAGDGSHERPFALRVEAPVAAIDHALAPVVVSLADDTMGLFQTRPPSPVDIAAVLRYLRKTGGGNAAIAAVFEWQDANPLAYQGLETVMDEFHMTVQAAPLKRGTVAEDMPAAFRRAAIPREAVKGDVRRLPMINGLAVKDMFFGGKKSLAGFSTLDDLALERRTPLLARWQDDPEGRLVLAFPALAVLARHDLPVDGVRVRLGQALELGPNGPVIPIDATGCMLLPPKPVPARVDVEAAELVMAEPDFLPRDSGLIVLRDDQSLRDKATVGFSNGLASVMAAIESDGGLASPQVYPRLPQKWEAGLVAALLAAGLAAGGLRPFPRNIALGCLAAGVVAGQWLGFSLGAVWLPGAPCLAGLLLFWGLCAARKSTPAQTPAPAPSQTTPDSPATRSGTGLRTVTIWKIPSHPQTTTAPEETPKPEAQPEAQAPARKPPARKKRKPPTRKNRPPTEP